MNQLGQIKFINKERNLFYATLNKRVDAYFKEKKISKNANATMVFKTVALLGIYLAPLVIFLWLNPGFGVSMLLWAISGFGLAGVGMSVMHDANHGAYSSSKTINYFLGVTLNLLGGSVFNWKLQHNLLHHTFTNIHTLDEDIDDKVILRFSPHTEVKKHHKFQWVYAFLFYCILTLYWVLLKDFIQFARYTRKGVNKQTKGQNRITVLKMVLMKIIYLFCMLVVPTLFLHIGAGKVVCGFLIMHCVAGFVLTTVFQLAHTVEGTTHPLPNETGVVENDWAIHQMNTTVNFSRKNRLISWYVGGLNFQVEHHLFPSISHIHYPAIAEITKTTAEEFGVPYLENRTLWDALRSHIATLQRFGKLPDINEALA
ncbi:MAG: fatty acid desaturase family protein [Bacteroidia bacterium]